MKLLILDGPRDPRPGGNPLYRGTYRAHPNHCDELPDDEEINKLFFWFLEEGGELGVVHDISKSLRFAALWNEHLKGKSRFEVVELTDADARPESKGTFIGFDLSAGYNNSLLSGGLRRSPGSVRPPDSIVELLDLLTRHYSPQLNENGLFQTLETASNCLRSMAAVQCLCPNLFEGGSLKDFSCVGLHAIRNAEYCRK